MKNLLTRFHYLKMLLVGILLGSIGVVLLIIGQQVDGTQTIQSSSSWTSFIPWNEFGEILIGAALLGIWFDHLFRKEQQAINDQRLRQVMHDHAPVMRDAVLQAFAANSKDLKRVATPETLDHIIGNSLALRLDDPQFANEIYGDIRAQAVEASERWHNADVTINLSPLPDQPDYFAVTVRWEYTTVPHHAERRFICLSDKQEYNELANTPDATSAWLRPEDNFTASAQETYELLQFSVNGKKRPIRRSTRKNYQEYKTDLGQDHIDAGEPITISYTYRTVTPSYRHLLFFDIEQPTRNISMTLDYSQCGVDTVSAIDLIPSIRPTRIEYSPEEVPTKTLRVEADGWTFPRSGIAFVWTLESEVSPEK